MKNCLGRFRFVYWRVVGTVLCCSLLSPARAQLAPAPPAPVTPAAVAGKQSPPAANAGANDKKDSAVNTGVPAAVTKTFGGLTFGVGVALSENIQNRSRIASAAVVNGVVRVSQVADAAAGLVLESHYFFVPRIDLPLFGVPAYDWGYGPFVAIVADTTGGNNVISAYALGWMIRLRQPDWDFSTSPPQIKYTSTSGVRPGRSENPIRVPRRSDALRSGW
jgi:hypothetical protein